MLRYLCEKKSRHSSPLLFFLAVCILVVCTAYEKPDIEKLSYSGMNSVSTISSPEREICDIVAKEYTGCSVLKEAVSRKSLTGRFTGFRTSPACATVNDLFVLIGLFGIFLLAFCRDLVTSHSIIISFIHNLDGMKP